MTDYKTWADADLATARDAIAAEIERRALLAQADQLAADLAARIAAASGKGRGEEWVQPTGAHDSYPAGAKVVYQGKTYISSLPFNPYPPSTGGWKPYTTGSEIPQWVQPLGAVDAYKLGDKVMYNGARYVSTVDANVWAPGVYGWKLDTTGQTTTKPPGGNA